MLLQASRARAKPTPRSRGARRRRWARLSSRNVERQPSAARALASCLVTPQAPDASRHPLGGVSAAPSEGAGATLVRRRSRAPR